MARLRPHAPPPGPPLARTTGTAVKVWEYRPTPDIYSESLSSAYRLVYAKRSLPSAGCPGALFLHVFPAGEDGFDNPVVPVDLAASAPSPSD